MLRKIKLKAVLASSVLLLTTSAYANQAGFNVSLGKNLVPTNTHSSTNAGEFKYESKGILELAYRFDLAKDLSVALGGTAYDGGASKALASAQYELMPGLDGNIHYQTPNNKDNTSIGEGWGIDLEFKLAEIDIGIGYSDYDENSEGHIDHEYGILLGYKDFSFKAERHFYDDNSGVEQNVAKVELSYEHNLNEQLGLHPAIYWAENIEHSTNVTKHDTGVIGHISYKF